MGPLKGIKIVEFSGIGPGPFCGMLLADLGADVIRISRPEQRGQHNKFDIHNRSKRTIVADLKNPETILEIHKLISQVDAVFEGFRPGVMERLGLGPEICFPLNKALVYGRMTGWGQDGDMSLQAGHDINYIGLSGALNSIGRADSNPVPPLNLIGDYGGGGMHLAVGMLSALISSLKTGEGQVVDSSMVDGSLALMSFFYSLNNMGLWNDQRESNLLDGAAHFYDTYKCSDGKFIAVGSIEPQFYKILLEKLDIKDSRFRDQMNKELWPEFKKIISLKVISKTRDDWMDIFSGSDACVTPVLDLEESKNHHHNVSRNAFVDMDGFNQPAPSPRFSNTPLNIKHNASEIGIDTVDVCSEFNLNKDLFI
jgi:alpha-methylacyl-CoA racemase